MKMVKLFQEMDMNGSDAKFIANSYYDFYKRVWERGTEMSAWLANPDEKVLHDYDSKIFSVNINDTTYIITPSSIKTQIMEYYNKIDDPEVDITTIDEQLIHIVDKFNSNKTVDVSINDFVNAISVANDSNWITAQAFQAIIYNFENPTGASSTFINSININVGDNTITSVKQSINAFFDVLSNNNLTTSDKLKSILNLTSVEEFVNDPEATFNKKAVDTILGNYTGINPVIGWLTGIDIDWTNVGEVITGVIKAAAKILTNGISLLGNFVVKAGKWIANWFTKTFIDPVDYDVEDGDEMFYFKTPTKLIEEDILYDSSLEDGNINSAYKTVQSNLLKCFPMLKQYLGIETTPVDTSADSNVIWFFKYNVLYKVTNQGATSISPTQIKVTTLIERYIKPTNIETAKELWNKVINKPISYISGPDADINNVSVTPSNNQVNGVTINDYRKFLELLSKNNMSCTKGIDEKVLLQSIALSLNLARVQSWLGQYLRDYKYTIKDEILDEDIINLEDRAYMREHYYPDWPNSIDPNYPDDDTGIYDSVQSLIVLGSYMTDVIKTIFPETNKNEYFIYRLMKLNSTDTVTNMKFIQVLTLFPISADSISGYNFTSHESHLVLGGVFNGFIIPENVYLDDSGTSVVKHPEKFVSNTSFIDNDGYYVISKAFYGSLNWGELLLSFLRLMYIPSTWDEEFAIQPYLRVSEYSFTRNVVIKTDEENIAAFNKFLTGTLIVAAVIAVAIFTGVKLYNLRGQSRILDAQLLSKKIKLGNAYNNMNYSDEYKRSVYSDYMKLVRKASVMKMLPGTVLGGSAVSASASILSDIKDSIFSSGDIDLTPVIKLIK